MIKIISPRKRVECVEYARIFELIEDPNAGFSFDCDADGNILEDELHPAGRTNLEGCLSGRYPVIDRGIRKYSWEFTEPAIGLCACGRQVILESSSVLPDNPCPCGRNYNSFGQELAPCAQWGEETGESLADIFSARDPEEIG